MKRNLSINLLCILLPIVIGFLSFAVVRPRVTSSEITGYSTSYLDEKRETVMEVTAASTTLSAAITLIPGDVGTPIAEKLADISGYSVVLLCAILLEKYLAVLIGHVSFGLIVPVACALAVANYLLFRSPTLRQAIVRFFIYALVLASVIPISVKASRMIEDTFQTSIRETIVEAQNSAQEIRDNTNGSEENDTLWKKFVSKLEGGVSNITNRFEGILNNFIEAVAVMLVTSCLIPLLVLFFLIWLTKQLPLNYELRPLDFHFPHH